MSVFGTFNMLGGEVCDNTATSSSAGGGVFTYGQIVLGGNAIIKNNTYSSNINNLYIRRGTAVVTDTENPLSGDAYIGITTRAKPTEGEPVNITGENDKDYSSFFHSDDPAYEIINGENNVIQLAVKPHVHTVCTDFCPDDIHIEHQAEKWTAWESTDGLPEISGCYYLTADVTLKNICNISNDIKLCLNGYNIYAEQGAETGVGIGIDKEVRFDLCDCTGSGTISTYIENNGRFYMYSGTIANGTQGVLSHDTFVMLGGRIAESKGVGVNNSFGIFTMYGGTIENNMRSGVENLPDSRFIMNGGSIVNNKSQYGNIIGVYVSGSVNNQGEFTMNGGTIADNAGNGVFNSQDGIFSIYGGSIENNKEYGVYNNKGTVMALGGKISENSGGVFVRENTGFTVGGTAVIKDNYETNDSLCNVNLQSGSAINIDVGSELKENAYIGVTTADEYADADFINITEENLKDYSGFFHSDNPLYEVINGENNIVQLLLKAHEHAVCEGSGNCADDGHTNIVWNKWSETDRLPENGEYYYLTEDVVLSESWTPADGMSLCLNGHTVTSENNTESGIINIMKGTVFNLCDCTGSGEIGKNTAVYGGGVFNDGTFNMYSGTIADNIANHGGGVYNLGVFNMYGGIICQNNAKDNGDLGGSGGGVFNDGTFNMYGGKIVGNSAEQQGGGLLSGGALFNMCGGEISGNNAGIGGGIYTYDSPLILGGLSVINDNKSGENPNNLYIYNIHGETIALAADNPLSGSSYIGISTEIKPAAGSSVNVTGENLSAQSGFFHSDDPAFEIANGKNNEVQLIKSHPHILIYHEAVNPACTEKGTAEYWICEGENGCGKIFADGNGETELGEIPIIAAIGHKWGKWNVTSPPTETVGGAAERICGNNEEHIDAAPLPALTDVTVWTKIEDTNATCSDEGIRIYISEYGMVEVKLQKLSHDYGEEWQKDYEKHWQECEKCGAIASASENPHIWDEGKITVEPTAEQEGEKTFACEVCGYTRTEIISKLEPSDTESNSETPVTPPSETEPPVDSSSETEPPITPPSETEPPIDSSSETEPPITPPSETEPPIDSSSETEPSITSLSDAESPAALLNDTAPVVTAHYGNIFEVPETTAAVTEQITSVTETSSAPKTENTTTPFQTEAPAEITAGSISKRAESADYIVEIPDSVSELVNNVLTQQEISLINSGSMIEILLTADKISTVSEADGAAIREALNGFKTWQYLDINLYKIIDGTRYKLDGADAPVIIKIDIPEALRNSEREYAMIRVHDGKGDILNDLDDSGDTITFAADKFSVYVLVYRDVEVTAEKEIKEDEPMNTGVDSYTSVFLAAGITAMSAAMTFTLMGTGIAGMSEERKIKFTISLYAGEKMAEKQGKQLRWYLYSCC